MRSRSWSLVSPRSRSRSSNAFQVQGLERREGRDQRGGGGHARSCGRESYSYRTGFDLATNTLAREGRRSSS